ncbi:MAG TPA: CBS domain-containing protein [Actinomycetota bacterium]|nr:CBS domain-containing protein [Actinomycetota bacterium]
MEIATLINRSVVSLEPSRSLRLAAERMAEHGVGSIVVASEGEAPGIFTERDLLFALAGEADPNTSAIESYMTKNAFTLAPSVDAVQAATRMHGEGFRHLIVINDDHTVAGVLSVRDLLGAVLEQISEKNIGEDSNDEDAEKATRVRRVGDCMIPDVISVSLKTNLDKAAQAMMERRVGAAIVMDHDRVAGIVTERDLMRAVANGLVPWTTPVGDCMTRKPRTITPFTTAGAALSLMMAHGFRHLPVMEDGELVGIVSMRALASG